MDGMSGTLRIAHFQEKKNATCFGKATPIKSLSQSCKYREL